MQSIVKYLVDLRNHGRSPHSLDFNYDVMSEDLFNYMTDHNIKKPIIYWGILLGESRYEVCFTYNEKVEKLLIADISPRSYNTDFHENLLKILYRLPLEDFNKREEIDEYFLKVLKIGE